MFNLQRTGKAEVAAAVVYGLHTSETVVFTAYSLYCAALRAPPLPTPLSVMLLSYISQRNTDGVILYFTLDDIRSITQYKE